MHKHAVGETARLYGAPETPSYRPTLEATVKAGSCAVEAIPVLEQEAIFEKILRNPAAYGAYVPYKRLSKNVRITDGEPILGFFPAVIDLATYQAVQAARVSHYRQ